MRAILVIACGLFIIAVLVMDLREEMRQRREIHDLRQYIAAGCHGHYEGEGEQP